MLQPERTKFRKMHKGHSRGLAQGTDVSSDDPGLRAIGHGHLTAHQIGAARRVMTHTAKCQGKIWIHVLLDKPTTEKPLAMCMDKGKDNVEYWVALAQPSEVLYEIGDIPEELACGAFKLTAAKLPIETTFVTKTVM